MLQAGEADVGSTQRGRREKRMAIKRPLPPVVLLLTIVSLGATHALVPLATVLRFPLTLLGLLPLGLGAYLNLAADALLKRHNTTVKPFETSASLVTSGVYGLSRHPMYLGFVLILLGIAVLLGSAMPLALVLLFAVLMDRTYVRLEETMLKERFGDAWKAYTRRVRRWV
jgi:protein-S-isoprenylcysteine O-methyltransferase Ste14